MLERRSFLSGLGAALSLPLAAEAAPSPDAALIAAAASVERLAAKRVPIYALLRDLEKRARSGMRAMPREIASPPKWEMVVDRHDDGGFTITQRPIAVDPAAAATKAQNVADIAAWHSEWAWARRAVGHHACARKGQRLYRRLEEATRALTPMAPQTPAGLAAKARAAQALDPTADGIVNEWEYELMATLLRDAVRIGGAA